MTGPEVRCSSCGKLVSKACREYQERLKKEGPEKSKDILDSLGLERTCCRIRAMTFTDISHDLPLGKRVQERGNV